MGQDVEVVISKCKKQTTANKKNLITMANCNWFTFKKVTTNYLQNKRFYCLSNAMTDWLVLYNQLEVLVSSGDKK